MMTTLEDHPNIEGSGASESWLRDFLDYVKRNEPFEAIDIGTEETFVKSLSTVSQTRWEKQSKWLVLYCVSSPQYLQSGPLYAKHDVHIEDGKIVGARFMLQAKNVVKTSEEKDFVIDIRQIVDKFPFKVYVFNPFFIFVDQVRFDKFHNNFDDFNTHRNVF